MEKKIDDLIKTITELKTSNVEIISSLNSHIEKFNRLDKRFDDLFNNFSMLMEENRIILYYLIYLKMKMKMTYKILNIFLLT